MGNANEGPGPFSLLASLHLLQSLLCSLEYDKEQHGNHIKHRNVHVTEGYPRGNKENGSLVGQHHALIRPSQLLDSKPKAAGEQGQTNRRKSTFTFYISKKVFSLLF